MSTIPNVSATTGVMPQVLMFDVNETLLDMTGVKRKVNRLLDSKRGFVIWYGLLLQYTLVGNSIGQFYPFADIAKATLDMAAHALGEVIPDQGKDDVVDMMRHLPVQEDVQGALSLLRDADFKLAILTNMPEDFVKDRLQRTGLISYFEVILSVEKIKQYKPKLEVYGWAADTLKVPLQGAMMVGAHGWDLAGAAAAGMQTAFISRVGQTLYPLVPEPRYQCKDLYNLARCLNEDKRD